MLRMNLVALTCTNCQKSFQRKRYEHAFRLKKGYAPCCSKTCGVTIRNKKSPNGKNLVNFRGTNKGRRNDKFSPFRCFLIKARSRRHKTTNLTVEYLSQLWERQKGICPYTGHTMELPINTNKPQKSPRKASLDRIDSEQGYEAGNVEFVCLSVNYAKNGFSKEKMLEFFQNLKTQ